MSWFKRGERRSPSSSEPDRSDTDPNTCLEVFQNHWKQVCVVFNGSDKRLTLPGGSATLDGVEAVLSNLEQMVTLLAGEDDDGGLPGPILQYLLEKDLLESFCSWCTVNVVSHDRLRLQQLRVFEHIISQSKQLLLVHRPIIKPLLRLLIDVSDSQDLSNNGELEFKLVLVLHQICICISQQSLILESFFSTDADHGPARFLIFSLLIPYIHREGPVGQKARDALLLIMTLSARHPHIGQYIANNSHFCPVLATGLSGLYSSLPRRLTPPSEDWYAITNEDCQRIPDLQMFLNSLEFSNAVVQIAHPLVRDQLIEFIYSGFLVPVLAPALHQDIPGLPIPLLDTDLFRISREEVMTATAYLDLFIRHVTDPNLLKAVLKFVMTQKYDDVLILDSLLPRINSSSHLSTVTLALFNTLINLNCEDIMYQLVFRYLVPCTHVMVSQRRSVRDLDLYGKSAEKFLSLRPTCCIPPPQSANITSNAGQSSFVIDATHLQSASGNQKIGSPLSTLGKSVLPELLESAVGESGYLDYLYDARQALVHRGRACARWLYRYDGENPLPDSIKDSSQASSREPESDHTRRGSANKEDPHPPTGFIELGSIVKSTNDMRDGSVRTDSKDSTSENVALNDHSLGITFTSKGHRYDSASAEDSVFLPEKGEETGKGKCNKGNVVRFKKESKEEDVKLYASLESLDSFLSYLSQETAESGADELKGSVRSVPEAASFLEEALKEIEKSMASRKNCNISLDNSTKLQGNIYRPEESALDMSSLSPISKDFHTFDRKISSSTNESEIPINDLSNLSSASENPAANATPARITANKTTAWDEVTASEIPSEPKIKIHEGNGQGPSQDSSSFVNISIVPSGKEKNPQGLEIGQLGVLQNNGLCSSVSSAVSASDPPSPPAQRKPRKVPKDFHEGFPSSKFLSSTPLFSPSSKQAAALASQGDALPSPYKPAVTPAEEFPPPVMSCPLPKKQLKYLNDPPNIGPFLSSLLSRLEGMAGNSLYFNLLLTGVISHLAAYPQPLLRSFLLNHNLVFQPSVKSLVQVLSSLRQKLDSYSLTVKEFDQLVMKARQNLAQREMLLYSQGTFLDSSSVSSTSLGSFTGDGGIVNNQQLQPNQNTLPAQNIKEKKKVSLGDIFRRSPGRDKTVSGKQKRSMSLLQRIQSPGSEGYKYYNHQREVEDRFREDSTSSPASRPNNTSSSGGGVRLTQTLSTWNAVYCSVVLDEFVKELSALSLEHSLLQADEGYLSS
ncbi:fts and hook-interacting protein homolog [Plakobranchus ocellatus]|uniref:Fts and hook-interacting protein homolog n=1 Tax=Plakobranchus ocellatus TaxID=259542 RepID=A0AAV4BFE6_9GAST|nr:fts and hook-interacting protein homolog [Plakobranchus ocellatus]